MYLILRTLSSIKRLLTNSVCDQRLSARRGDFLGVGAGTERGHRGAFGRTAWFSMRYHYACV